MATINKRNSNYEIESRFLKELNIVDIKKPPIPKPQTKKDNFFLEEKEEVFDSGFKVGDKVFHNRFGEGTILNISDDGLVGKIKFDVGVKELMLNIASLEKVEENG